MRLQRLISTRLASSGRDANDMAEAGRIVFCWHFCWHSRVEEFQILAALAVRFGGGGRNRLSIPAVALRICLILLAIQALPALSDPIIFNPFGVRFGVRLQTKAARGKVEIIPHSHPHSGWTWRGARGVARLRGFGQQAARAQGPRRKGARGVANRRALGLTSARDAPPVHVLGLQIIPGAAREEPRLARARRDGARLAARRAQRPRRL